MYVRTFTCVWEALSGSLLVEAHCSGEMLSQQCTAPFYWLLLQLAVFLAAGAPRGEIQRDMQQEDARLEKRGNISREYSR